MYDRLLNLFCGMLVFTFMLIIIYKSLLDNFKRGQIVADQIVYIFRGWGSIFNKNCNYSENSFNKFDIWIIFESWAEIRNAFSMGVITDDRIKHWDEKCFYKWRSFAGEVDAERIQNLKVVFGSIVERLWDKYKY